MQTLELEGTWRLFTPADFTEVLENWQRERQRASTDPTEQLPAGIPYLNATERVAKGAIAALRRHVNALQFEHGTERKVPRANAFRPYRLTLEGTVAALITHRSSEAFNLCEVDVFLTTELPGLPRLETTRAALLFVFCDAVKNGGSMAVQFTRACSPEGVPQPVRALADRCGVRLDYAARGALSPAEVRELYLHLCGLPESAAARVRDLSRQGRFSIERVCALVTLGVWPVAEAAEILECSPHADLLFGSGVETSSRHLSAHALAYAQSAILGGHFARALRYAPDAGAADTPGRRQIQFPIVPQKLDPDRLSTLHGPLPRQVALCGWSPGGVGSIVFPAGASLHLLARGRSLDGIRVFLAQDLEEARAVGGAEPGAVVLAYPADYAELTDDERAEAEAAAKRRGVTLLACPDSAAALEAETWRRMRIARTVRR